MIQYPAAYIAENEKLEKIPSTIVEIVEGGFGDSTSPNTILNINGSPTSSLSSSVGHVDKVSTPFSQSSAIADPVSVPGVQSFILPSFRSANITSVQFWLRMHNTHPGTTDFEGDFHVQFFADSGLSQALTNSKSVEIELSATGDGTDTTTLAYTPSFVGETFNFLDGVTYYARVSVTGEFTLNFADIEIMGDTAGGYTDGHFRNVGGADNGYDLDFTFGLGTMWDNYLTPKVIEYDLNLGEVPTIDGEWIIKDTAETGTTTAYTAESSPTGAFAGEEASLGTIVDGDAITDLKQYYRITATLTTTVPHNTPSVLEIRATFETILKISDTAFWGYEPAFISASTITKTIDDFKPSTIGQVSFKTGYSDNIRSLIENKFLKGNTVRIKTGFISSDFIEGDFVNKYLGRIENWVVGGDNVVTFILKDFQRDLSTKIPIIGTDGATTNIVYTAVHPVTVMLDIIQNQVGIRTSKVDVGSFDAVVTALSGWVVTRTLIEPEEAQKFLEELRLLTSTYFIPQNDGKIVLKQWDKTESSVRDLTEVDFLPPALSIDGNNPSLFNFVLIYYNWDGDGFNTSDFASGSGSVDAASLENWGLSELKQIKDKWTRTAQAAQVETARDSLQNRYKDPPKLLSGTVDSKHSALEVGDIVTADHGRIPSFITESKLDDWANVGILSEVRSKGSTATIGGFIYIFGGHDGSAYTNKIMRAPVSEPLNWANVGTLSEIKGDASVAIIGEKVYLFGGDDGSDRTDTIISAPISDPTNWSSDGTLSEIKALGVLAVIGGKIYIFGGSNLTVSTDTIISAPISDPTNWSSDGTLSEIKSDAVLAVIGVKIYIFGGLAEFAHTNTIISAPISDPTDWSSDGTLSEIKALGAISVTGDFVYIFGGRNATVFTDTIISAPISDPTDWSSAGTLSETKGEAVAAEIGNFIYLFGGVNDSAVTDTIGRARFFNKRYQIISVNPTNKNTINLKLLGVGK